jgi:hypothetical protein
VVVNVSGRGDKDMSTYMRYMDTFKSGQDETTKLSSHESNR